MTLKKIKLGNIEIVEPRPIVLEALRYISNGSALDLGAGFGRHSLLLAERGFSVTAVEMESEKIKNLEMKASMLGVTIRTEKSDVRHYDPKNEKFDLILSTMVLHFLSSEQEVETEIGKMKECTRPNGINVVCAYSDKNEPGLRPILPNANSLQELYKGWKTLLCREVQVLDEDIHGMEKRIWRVEMIVQKTSE